MEGVREGGIEGEKDRDRGNIERKRDNCKRIP